MKRERSLKGSNGKGWTDCIIEPFAFVIILRATGIRYSTVISNVTASVLYA